MPRRATTIPDLLAALAGVTIILVLVLSTFAGAQTRAQETTSSANLRTIGAAHTVYAADWNGRQVTWIDDEITSYGRGCAAFERYENENGFLHPPVSLGWGQEFAGRYRLFAYRTSHCPNAYTAAPTNFGGLLEFFGSSRLMNSTQFNQYVGGRWYDPTFYAPKDTLIIDAIDAGGCFDVPDGFCTTAEICPEVGDHPAWTSYMLSPAAMFDPEVMARNDLEDPDFNGWRDPWDLPNGFRSPALTDAAYPSLKTHVLEHQWLQNNPKELCNPSFIGTYPRDDECCEPFYFNHAWQSSPVTLFYDGHVGNVSVLDAVADDEQVREQNNGDFGLWSKDTPWGDDGYLIEYGYCNDCETSFHVLTTDGIRGRDVLQHGAPRPRPARGTSLGGRADRHQRVPVEGLRRLRD